MEFLKLLLEVKDAHIVYKICAKILQSIFAIFHPYKVPIQVQYI